ncbi:Poly(ADP-ribose) glycohydrolase, partial [Geodia barretti]
MASGKPSPPPIKKSRTRQLTLEESMAGATGSTSRPRETPTCDTPPLFSDSESEQPSSQDDSQFLNDDLHSQTSATLSYPASPQGTPPPAPQGVLLSQISFGPSCNPILPPLSSSPSHTVTFHTRLRPGHAPRPHPDKFCDVWDSNHVRSPCSSQSLYPVKTNTGEKVLMSRWTLIRASLSKPIANSYDLEEAIMEYNSRQAGKWSFGALHAYFSEAACLLANGFFCTFPRRNAFHRGAEFSTYPSVNFNTLFSGRRTTSIHPVRVAKLKCLFHYFTCVTSKPPTGVLTFTRQVCKDPPHWDKCSEKLSKLHLSSEGTIEDDGHGMLQVDFANKRVGGGVLGSGAVQEEIRFLICPELILSRLFTEELQENESLVITGAERFSSYSGYGSTFEWAGSHTDSTARDSWGRRDMTLVAMDAIVVRNSASQFKPGLIRRELLKAYCSFTSTASTPCGRLRAVATGNWGCGAFGGDKRLKALLQWLAASAAGRDVVYFTFGDKGLRQDLHVLQEELVGLGATSVADVWRVLLTYHRQQSPQPPLYKF